MTVVITAADIVGGVVLGAIISYFIVVWTLNGVFGK